MWTISVPPGFSLLLEFDHLELEDDSACRHDRLTVSAGPRAVVGTLHTHGNTLRACSHIVSLAFPDVPGLKCSAVYPGRFCGSVPPGRVLMSNSQNATLLFSSDINQAGSGFVVRHRALWGRADPGGMHKMKHTATNISAECITADPYRSVIHIRYRFSIYSSVTHNAYGNLEGAAGNVTAQTEPL